MFGQRSISSAINSPYPVWFIIFITSMIRSVVVCLLFRQKRNKQTGKREQTGTPTPTPSHTHSRHRQTEISNPGPKLINLFIFIYSKWNELNKSGFSRKVNLEIFLGKQKKMFRCQPANHHHHHYYHFPTIHRTNWTNKLASMFVGLSFTNSVFAIRLVFDPAILPHDHPAFSLFPPPRMKVLVLMFFALFVWFRFVYLFFHCFFLSLSFCCFPFCFCSF